MNKITPILILLVLFGQAQNGGFENPIVSGILQSNYDPVLYVQQQPVTNPDVILSGIQNGISPDSLFQYLERLDDFETRNTGSDTISTTRGIGAARNWILKKFNDFSAAAENRLVTSHFYFTQNICSVTKHKNVVAVLPGLDTTNKEIIILEGHFDSRCESVCDTACVAHGMEDNGSGTALVMELARVMSQYSYPQTFVFMATTGEEQGLYGANAFANYLQANGIVAEGVLNNDVIGGIICGQTSSPPGCPGANNIDSTQVRLFSRGGVNSINKCLARFVKLQYEEEVLPTANVPMQVSLMSAEDRTGRSGDHIPFRAKGMAAIRFTSANEHGDAGVGATYTDRQHTVRDVLGVDTDGDQVIDSFYVDFNYLARNAVINGVAAAALAYGPSQPDFSASGWGNEITVNVTDPTNTGTYRLGVRSAFHDYDTLITFTGTSATVTAHGSGNVYLSIMAVDADGIESLPDKEQILFGLDNGEIQIELPKKLGLLQNHPNPFDDATIIAFNAPLSSEGDIGIIAVTDMSGKQVARLEKEIEAGLNEIEYHHGYGMTGTFVYSLEVEGKLIDTKQMVFAN